MKNLMKNFKLTIMTIGLLTTAYAQSMGPRSLVPAVAAKTGFMAQAKAAGSQVTGKQAALAATALLAAASATGAVPVVAAAAVKVTGGLGGLAVAEPALYAAGVLAGRAYAGSTLYFIVNDFFKPQINKSNVSLSQAMINPENMADDHIAAEADSSTKQSIKTHGERTFLEKLRCPVVQNMLGAHTAFVSSDLAVYAASGEALGKTYYLGSLTGLASVGTYHLIQKYLTNKEVMRLESHTPENIYELAALHEDTLALPDSASTALALPNSTENNPPAQ